MSDMRDIRSKVDSVTYAAVQAEMAARGLTESEVVREVLDPWAKQRVHAANVLRAHLACEGDAVRRREGEG